ncbi:MAG: TonB-dependent receptor [Chitinophagaceae bacterium]
MGKKKTTLSAIDRTKGRLLTVVLLLGISVISRSQQTHTISGLVVSKSSGLMVENATIQNITTSKNVVTDEKGRFTIPANTNDRIAVSALNYIKDTITVGAGKTYYTVYLNDAANSLNDVVVVGYGSVKKADVTGSIAQANMADLLKAPVKSFDEMLAGRVAGVQVTSSDGQPGANVNIVVRGANSVTQDNSPLYVIDGFPIENPDNNALNPDDIESLEVLKDASATAIYGARGANGVIIITTKKGKAGAPVVSLTSSYGIQKARKKIDMMQPADFVQYMLDYNSDTTSWNSSISVSSITPYQLYFSGGTTMAYYQDTAAFYDWQSRVLRTAPILNTTLNVSGGNGGTRYSVSGNIVNQDGIILNSNYKRYQGRASLDQTFNSRFKVGINANYSRLEMSGISVAQSTNSATTNLMYSVWGYRPVQASPASQAATGVNDDYASEDAYTDESVSSSQDYRFNPVKNLKNAYSKNKTDNLIVNAYLEYKIIPRLTLRVTGGINNRSVRQERFNNSNTQYGNAYTNSNGPNGSIYDLTYNSWVNENTLTYSNTFAKEHSLTAMVGMTEQKNTSSTYGYTAIQVPNESLGINALSQGTVSSTTSLASSSTLASYLARINYGYKSRYLLTLSAREDGSSKFATGNKWGQFFSGALAWRFSKETFLRNVAFLDDGKLRMSYGATGNNKVSDFAYLPEYSQTASNTSVYTFNNTAVTGAVPTTIGNTDLKWETTYQLDLGLDLTFLRNRISFTGDVYSKETKNLLLNASVPTSTGYSTVYKNVGNVQNNGLELTLNTVNITNEKFTWTSTFNISFNKSKVLSLAEDQESLLSSIAWDNNWSSIPAYIAKVGQPLGMMYGYIWDGVYQYSDFDESASGTYTLKSTVTTNGNTRANIQPGDIKYRDVNGDGVVDAKDYTVIGHGLPLHIGGFGNNFSYAHFDLNIFFQWSCGNDIQNVNRMVFEGNALGKSFLEQYASYNNYWTSERTNTDQFRVKGYYGGGYSSKTVEDGSYLRLKTISLGYNMPSGWLKKYKIKSFRIFGSAQNLVTWTRYSGVDPEVNAYSSVLTGGFDYSPYPRAKTYVLGVNVSF